MNNVEKVVVFVCGTCVCVYFRMCRDEITSVLFMNVKVVCL